MLQCIKNTCLPVKFINITMSYLYNARHKNGNVLQSVEITIHLTYSTMTQQCMVSISACVWFLLKKPIAFTFSYFFVLQLAMHSYVYIHTALWFLTMNFTVTSEHL